MKLPAGGVTVMCLASCLLGMPGCFQQETTLPMGRSVSAAATGPLAKCLSNPRYFCDGNGKVVLLTGSHTWDNFQDWFPAGSAEPLDYQRYLDFLQQNNHNFFRLWVWEQGWGAADLDIDLRFAPLPYPRTGPGKALDGGARFDLSRFNDGFFERLRSRVKQAGDRGFYVSVMLFNGWSVDGKSLGKGNPWHGHPFNRANNINGVDGDPAGTGFGLETHSLRNPEVTRLQEAYVRRVVETLRGLDNVLWEISNESPTGSQQWHRHFIDFIRRCEARNGRAHPVGMTSIWPGGNNNDLAESGADWISPNQAATAPYKDDPPAADGRQVVLVDTDHLWGIGGTHRWAWKSFLRGLNPLFMDPYTHSHVVVPDVPAGYRLDYPAFVGLRSSLGVVRSIAATMDLAVMAPRNDFSSTGYCLARPGREYLVYQPSAWPFWVRLEPGTYRSEWVDPVRGTRSTGTIEVESSGKRLFWAPSRLREDAVLHLTRSEQGKFAAR